VEKLFESAQGIFLLLQIGVFIATPIVLSKVNKAYINGIHDDLKNIRDDMKTLREEITGMNQNFIDHLSSHGKR
jgi:hypothetical protein